jgi:hypothetical protein
LIDFPRDRHHPKKTETSPDANAHSKASGFRYGLCEIQESMSERFPSGAINRDETNAAPFFIFCPHYEKDFCPPRPSGRMLANKTYRDAW